MEDPTRVVHFLLSLLRALTGLYEGVSHPPSVLQRLTSSLPLPHHLCPLKKVLPEHLLCSSPTWAPTLCLPAWAPTLCQHLPSADAASVVWGAHENPWPWEPTYLESSENKAQLSLSSHLKQLVSTPNPNVLPHCEKSTFFKADRRHKLV